MLAAIVLVAVLVPESRAGQPRRLDWPGQVLLALVLAGAATLPMAMRALVCAPVSGRLVGRIGPRVPLLAAGACLPLGGARW